MTRPVGLILSAIVLSLAALFFLLMTAVIAFAGIFTGHQPVIAAAPHLVSYLMLAISVFYAVLAVWAILTVIGILRLRSWARYSILIMGGGLALIGVFAAFGTLVSRTMLSNLPTQQQAVDPHIMSVGFVVMGVIDLLIAAIGAWWLVYFTRHPIRDLFRPSAPVPPYYAPVSPSFSAEAHGTAGVPNPPPIPYSQPTFSSLPAKSSTGFFSSPEHAPAAIKILGWLFLVFAVCCLPMIFLPLPAFILGFIIPVKASHFLYLATLTIAASIGYGLIKLRNSARLALIAFVVFGIGNLAVSLLPWSQNQFREYTAQLMARFTALIPTIPGQSIPSYTYPTATIIFNSVLGIAINLYVLWLVHRHRTAFTAPPPLPEQS